MRVGRAAGRPNVHGSGVRLNVPFKRIADAARDGDIAGGLKDNRWHPIDAAAARPPVEAN